MMFRRVIKKPGFQECKRFEIDAVTIKKYMTEETVRLTIYSNSVVYGGNEYGESCHLSIFTLLKHCLVDAFEVQFFQGFIFTP